MHELPEGLTNSLRSWRGSAYANSAQKDNDDLEKGPEDHGEKTVETLSPAQSHGNIHHNASHHSLRRPSRVRSPEQRKSEDRSQHQKRQSSKHGNESKQPEDPAKPTANEKRQATPQPPTPNQISVFAHAPRVKDPDPAADRLADDETPLTKEHFYELMGMQRPTPNGDPPKELGTPHGIYKKMAAHKDYVQTKYRIFDVLQYIFLALQLVLSATFIILGSVRADVHIPIAVLGAVSTVVGGVLALMKGQGLPNRLRQVRDDLKYVLLAAEELYWDVAADQPVLFEDVKKIREDYFRVCVAARRNHPDSWTEEASSLTKNVRHRGRGNVKVSKA